MFDPRIKVIKMSKMAHFLYFLLMTAENSTTVLAKHFSASERSYLAYLEKVMDYWVLCYH